VRAGDGRPLLDRLHRGPELLGAGGHASAAADRYSGSYAAANRRADSGAYGGPDAAADSRPAAHPYRDADPYAAAADAYPYARHLPGTHGVLRCGGGSAVCGGVGLRGPTLLCDLAGW